MIGKRLHTLAVALIALCCVSACDSDDEPRPRATAHVVPLQAVSLEGLLPEGTRSGYIRFEAEHFAYELPLTTTTPASILAPIYVGKDGSFEGGKVSLYWLAESGGAAGDSAGDGGKLNPSESTERPEGAVDLGLDLIVAPLPKFAYTEAPGVLVHAFLTGALTFQKDAYRDAIANVGRAAAMELETMRDESIAGLTAALEVIETVRQTGEMEPMGTLALERSEMDLGMSLASLTIADQLVAAFLIASRTATWQPQVTTPAVASRTQALSGDLLAQARDWFPSMTDELASTVLDRASKLSSVVGHATLAVGVLGTLGVVAAPTALAATAVGAFSFFALTYAPAATAAVIRAAGNLVRGGGTLNGYAYDTIAPSLKHVVTQNLSYCLGMVQDKIASKIAGASKGAAALAQLAGAVSDFSGTTASRVSNWLVGCASDPSECTPLAGADGGVGGGGPAGDAGTTVGTCNQAQTAGGDTPETRTFDVGTRCADLSLTYDTQTVEDAITVTYEGKVVADTGCVGAAGNLPFSICGTSSEVVVSVMPNCAGSTGTAWTFTLACPD